MLSVNYLHAGHHDPPKSARARGGNRVMFFFFLTAHLVRVHSMFMLNDVDDSIQQLQCTKIHHANVVVYYLTYATMSMSLHHQSTAYV